MRWRKQGIEVRPVEFVIHNLSPALALIVLLDRFPPPNFLKMDVEGAELIALQGASRLLAEARPLIYCEVGEDLSSQVYELLRKSDYQVFDGDQRTLTEVETAPWSTLAIPAEKSKNWK